MTDNFIQGEPALRRLSFARPSARARAPVSANPGALIFVDEAEPIIASLDGRDDGSCYFFDVGPGLAARHLPRSLLTVGACLLTCHFIRQRLFHYNKHPGRL
jgi:hypothetical protein